MAFANVNISDLVATTLENRSGEIADNVLGNIALLMRLKKRGNVKTFSGGTKILQELNFAENPNVGWYSGYDPLPTGTADVISAAEFAIKQSAAPVVFSGLDEIMNSGKERIIDLVAGRVDVAESTMLNLHSAGLYSDGTSAGGKQVTGLAAAVPVDPTTGTYGGINRANYPFWRSYALDTNAAPSSATIQGFFNTAWANLVRGTDKPDLIPVDNTVWAAYMASLQPQQRFTDPEMAQLGFSTIKFMTADVVLDGGIGGDCTAATAYFLNTKYLFWRPYSGRNMVPLDSGRQATNMDATVKILAWAGNLTCAGARFQGQILFS